MAQGLHSIGDNTMAFMEHEITGKQAWFAVEGDFGTDFIPIQVISLRYHDLTMGQAIDHTTRKLFDSLCTDIHDYTQHNHIYTITPIEGYGARVSAPGYLDCTEWAVFDTAEEAQAYLDEEYPKENDMERQQTWQLAGIVPEESIAEGGDPNGRYAVRTQAIMHHEGDCNAGGEELEEVIAPQGDTIAYFVHADTADLFCAFMNKAHGLTK